MALSIHALSIHQLPMVLRIQLIDRHSNNSPKPYPPIMRHLGQTTPAGDVKHFDIFVIETTTTHDTRSFEFFEIIVAPFGHVARHVKTANPTSILGK